MSSITDTNRLHREVSNSSTLPELEDLDIRISPTTAIGSVVVRVLSPSDSLFGDELDLSLSPTSASGSVRIRPLSTSSAISVNLEELDLHMSSNSSDLEPAALVVNDVAHSWFRLDPPDHFPCPRAAALAAPRPEETAVHAEASAPVEPVELTARPGVIIPLTEEESLETFVDQMAALHDMIQQGLANGLTFSQILQILAI